ncbi:MAG: cell division protein ZapA [Alphaproteobacteria bacterium]|nr:cell division protein ZapA [Alphaproteobacteria bacterium]
MRQQAVKLGITLYNREYTVNCGAGEETRLQQVADLVQKEMQAVADKVGNATEPRHLMLTCLSLADKLLEARSHAVGELAKQEDLFVTAVDYLRQRVTDLSAINTNVRLVAQ